ncbi:hypothetical protein OG562_20250 [Streptomyces sp. NBC_01275]|uniref:hypothetical protein n=1 Tax=Streptomyces sp. NBC_01275 TaxID=2903807 RepID=UPI00225A7876|nr:hypothetical protein [Streptomyces sp. NBC_01275]MCX4763258.1 hypothetical protein [Streptomyces sp. NBC_01275]
MAREISGLAKEASDCYVSWIRGRSVGDIAEMMGLTPTQVELRISRARTSRAELTGSGVLTDVSATLDDVIRRSYELLDWDLELKVTDHLAVLELITDTAMKKAELYGLVTGESDA